MLRLAGVEFLKCVRDPSKIMLNITSTQSRATPAHTVKGELGTSRDSGPITQCSATRKEGRKEGSG